MHRILLSAILCLLIGSLYSQGILPGLVTYQNSGNKPVAGATVSSDLGNTRETGADGSFLMTFPGKAPGYEIYLSLDYAGYEVVNRGDLFLTLKADQSKRKKFYICLKGQWNRYALEYYEINEQAITLRYRQQIRVLQDRVKDDRLRSDSLKILRQEFEAALDEAKHLSEDFAKANLDDANETYRQAHDFFSRGKIDSALNLLRRENPVGKLETAKENKAELQRLLAIEDSVIQAQIENALLQGRLYATRFQIDSAVYCYQAAVDADTTDWANVFKFARFLQQQNRFTPATRQYERALRLAGTLDQQARTLHNMGATWVVLSEPARALEAFEEALKIHNSLAQKGLEQRQSVAYLYMHEVFGIKNNIGHALLSQDKYDDALTYFEEALGLLDVLEGKLPHIKILEDRSLILNNIAVVFDKKGENDRAILFYQESIDSLRHLSGSNDENHISALATGLINLASVKTDEGFWEEAIQHYEEGIILLRELVRKNPERYRPDWTLALHLQGNTLVIEKDYSAAKLVFEKAVSIRRDLAKQQPRIYSPGLAKSLCALGGIHHQLLAFSERDECLREAQYWLSKCPDSPEKEEARDRLGEVKKRISNSVISLKPSYDPKENVFLQEILVSAYEKTITYQDLEDKSFRSFLAKEYNKLTWYALTVQDYSLADSAAYRALELDSSILSIQANLAHSALLQGRFSRAKKLYTQLMARPHADPFGSWKDTLLWNLVELEMSSEIPLKRLPDVAAMLSNWGNTWRTQKEYTRSGSAYEEALKIYRKLAETNEAVYLPNVAATLSDLGNAWTVQNDFARGITAYEEALEICRTLAKTNEGVSLPDVAHLLNNLGASFFQQSKMEEARILLQEAADISTRFANQQAATFGVETAFSLSLLGFIHHNIEQVYRRDSCWQAAQQWLDHSSETAQREQIQGVLNQLKQAATQSTQQAEDPLTKMQSAIQEATPRAEKVLLQQELIEYLQANYDQDDKQVRTFLSQQYGNLSFYALFTQDFSLSESSARKALGLDPHAYTNLAPALLLQGKYKDAKAIYLRFKGQAYDDSRSWNDVFLADLDELEAAGAIPSKHMKDVKKIRKLLRD